MPVGQYSDADVVTIPPPGTGQYSDTDVAPKQVNIPISAQSPARRFVSNFAEQVNPVEQLKSLGDTISKLVTHPVQTLTDIGTANDAPRVAAEDAFKRGDYVEGVRHGVNWLLNTIPGVGTTMEKASDQAQSGDIAGGIGKTLGLATALGVEPKIGAKVLDVATEPGVVSDVANSVAAVPGKVAGTVAGTVFKIPGDIVKNAAGAAGVMVGEHVAGWPGAIAGGAVGRSIGKAVYDKLQNLAATRAAAAYAASELAARQAAVQAAQQDAATAIKAAPLPETPTEAPAVSEVIPPERQLPPASAPPIVAGPITPRADMAPPVTSVPDTSGPIPTDQVTGRPIAASATPPVANATSEVAAPKELVSLDEIAKGLGSGIKGFKDLTAQQQALAQQVYDEIHAGPTYVAPAPALEPSATFSTAVPAKEPIASQPETVPLANESTTPPEVPRGTSPEQTSTPRKSRGFDELNAQITADLAKQKPPSVPASTPEDAADAAKIVFRDGSVAHLTPEQTQALHDYVTGKGGEIAGKSDNPIPTAYRSKSQTGLQIPQEAAARDAIAQTAAEHLYKTGIKPEQIRALTPDAQKLFWDNLSQLEGLSPQAHYSMSPATIDATMGKLVKMSKGGAVAHPAPVPPQVTVSGKPVAGMSAQQIAEMLQQEMMK